MNHIGPVDAVCLLAILVAAYMFHKVYVIVSTPSPTDLDVARARYQFVLDAIRTAQTVAEKVGAFILAAIALVRGTGKVAFITAGLTLAVAVVGGGCPSLAQAIFDYLTKRFT